MKFTDLFVNRPVLAIVVSTLILVLGLRAVTGLTVRQYPKTENATVTVTTAYYGADAQTMAGFVTQPLEQAIAQAQGIDYLSSSSVSGVSTITATLRLNYDANRALSEINTQVNSVRNKLPPAAQQPVLTVQTGETIDAMYMGFYSDELPTNNITDYLARVVKPKLDSIAGVQTAELLGARQFALRAWLDPARMAAHGVTASDVHAALAANNYLAAIGSTKGQAVTVDLTTDSDLHTVDEFRQLAIKQHNGAIVRLQDVAHVTLGSENYDANVAFGGKSSVFIGIKVAPDANILDVARRVREAFPGLQRQLPNSMTGAIVYDATAFVNTSIHEVIKTLVEALLIVTAVIFLFLGSLRAVVIPLVAMPLSMVGTFFMMLVLGYSINLLTLLALVLAIGLVVDDAIIVVENVDRHMKDEGKTPRQAALLAARELGGPILAMTVVLIAVYAPIGFQKGLTGALFTEFAFTLAGAVTVSAVIALTLSPMMCSRFFRASANPGRLPAFIDRQFERVSERYQRALHGALDTWVVLAVMGGLLFLATIALGMTASSELAPEEDQGVVIGQIVGAPNATAQQMDVYAHQMFDKARSLPEYDQMFQITGTPTINQGIGGVLFKPWDQRSRNAHVLQTVLQQKWNDIAGARVAAFQFPALPGASGLPIQLVITTTEPFRNLYEVAQAVKKKAQASGKFYYIDSNLKLDKPQSTIVFDRDLITALGLTQKDVGASLSAALGGGYVNYFSIAGRSYKVIPQVRQADRLNPDQVLDYYLGVPDGALIPAATVATLKPEVVPQSLNRFQQLNSATISGVSGMSQGAALAFLRTAVHDVAPGGDYHVDYSGASRQFEQESGGFVNTLLLATIIVFLVLAAQFNSLRDPAVILVSVPLALFGALIFVNLFTSLNIYTEVGLVTLMGLISKHGILIVQFANDLQRAGLSKREAIEQAAGVRLRPILMTTAAMVLGVVPLVIATGAGAAGRFNMGLVISTGLAIGTLFTLFVVPAFYMLLAARHETTSP
ncbi:efflux RND transporter permease subunit [Salinisphaera sp. LB1]|uniref:efflux RND transporter permease subunit n=1 Tax=Salinisphaera sp. LB1 TaxID=2183911 RepID=UPI000D70718D|nr:efflux RND transporter permease subunit [Salinisphaera sp. LB1]AWN15963.1 RND multidrug efflux transporter [Salinisphaera sp. LB1]